MERHRGCETSYLLVNAITAEIHSQDRGQLLSLLSQSFRQTPPCIRSGSDGLAFLSTEEYDSFEALQANGLTNTIFKEISEKTPKASKELAQIYGEPDLLKGDGQRNITLMAIAPTTFSSAILGQTSP